MILDSSALVAILHREPGHDVFLHLIEQAAEIKISAANYFETSIVIDSERDPLLSHLLDEVIAEAQIKIEPVTVEQAQIARQAYRDYGRGSGHAAGLNFGDCFSYALAKVTREPLLFKGDDFSHTELMSAVEDYERIKKSKMD
jgi:ribonuclease VapC